MTEKPQGSEGRRQEGRQMKARELAKEKTLMAGIKIRTRAGP